MEQGFLFGSSQPFFAFKILIATAFWVVGMLKMCITHKILSDLGLVLHFCDKKKGGEKLRDIWFFLFMKWPEHIKASFLENRQTNKYSLPRLAIL